MSLSENKQGLARMSEIRLSVVLPTHRENENTYLLKIAETYPQCPGLELIVVDSETSPSVLDKIKRPDFKISSLPQSTRAAKLNHGLEMSMGAMVLFHHPRSLVETQGLHYLIENHDHLVWGGFTHRFDQDDWGLKFTSWYSNRVRPQLSRILYLDHCVFFQRRLLTQKLPDIPIFEDTELSYILRKYGSPEILPFFSTTSSIRFQKKGFWRQALLNQRLKLEFHFGRSKNKMNREYESELNLNG
jgi:hypothetical protein